MDDMKRVWFVDVGSMPTANIENYLAKLKEAILEDDGEDRFIPIRPNSQTKVVELGRPFV